MCSTRRDGSVMVQCASIIDGLPSLLGLRIGRLFARGNPHMSEAECAAYDAPFPSSDYES